MRPSWDGDGGDTVTKSETSCCGFSIVLAVGVVVLAASCGGREGRGVRPGVDAGTSACPLTCPMGTTCDPTVGCVGSSACATSSDCVDTDACTETERCDPASRRCVYSPLDGDGDGEPPVVCGGRDCDDADPSVGTRGTESCDLRDNDCDGVVDDEPTDCPAGSRCTAGACECTTPGFELCSFDACADTRSDPENCGSCFRRCDSTTTCVAGECVCSGAGLTLCGTTCVDLSSDPSHCGSCGTFCSSGSCATGVCDGFDAGPPPDAGARPDAGSVLRDAGVRVDAGAPCAQGVPCTPDRGCSIGECIAETAGTIGDATDPISGLPGGATTIPTTNWVGGYCTTDLALPVGTAGACDPDAPTDVDDGCGTCGQCAAAGEDASGRTVTLCLAACTPAATTNPCRAGYTCQFGLDACVPGCGSDTECRVYRRDNNANGIYDPGVDLLTYDPLSSATCNMTTGRCDQPGAVGAVAGIACTRDAQCEANGECFAEIAYGWDGGYCTKRGCDLVGRACAGAGSVCQDIGVPLCLRGCDVGAEPVADRLGVAGHGAGCRAGYKCLWNEIDGAGVPNNGACIPGNYNAIVTNNVGAACNSTGPTDDPDARCYSPFGYGRCLTPALWGGTPALPSGMCTILNCAAPGIDTAMPCGPSGQCVSLGGTLTACFANCTTAATCPTGYACGEVGLPTDPHACVPNCAADGDCTVDRRCQIPVGELVGRCVLR